MIRPIGPLAALCLCLAAVPPVRAEAPAAPYHVGEASRLIHPARPRYWRGAATEALITRIWYPADPAAPEAAHDIGSPGHALFVGHPLAQGAGLAAARGRWPLILLSHGTGGSADSLDWLGAALAAEGYVVVGVNHPGNTALEPLTRDGFLLWWERASDLSDALDAILADPQFGPRIDRQRIGAAGFSIGGYTVLALAGARITPGALEAFCRSDAADALCRPPEAAQAGLDLLQPVTPSPQTAASMARSGRSYRDPRLKAVFAIAPAVGEAFGPGGFSEVQVPVEMIAGAADTTAPVATNIARIAGFLPAASVTLLPGAGHYTFLDVCVPDFARAVPAICADAPGVDRAAIHDAAIARARAFFARTLAEGAQAGR